MMQHPASLLFALFFFFQLAGMQAQSTSLQTCFEIAEENNHVILQMKQSLKTRQFRYQAAKLNALPEIDILAGYHYLGEPLQVNLQTVKNGIIEGSAQQSVNTANQVFYNITGQELSANAQQIIYQSTKSLINGIYPKFNPALSEQQYFTATVALRQPIYLGGKLNAAQKVAEEKRTSGHLNLEFAKNTVAYAVVAQYLQIQYLNAMLHKQEQLVQSFQKTEDYARSMVKSEIIPPYQKKWASVALSQAQTGLAHFKLEKKNALLRLQHLLGTTKDLYIQDSLQIARSPLLEFQEGFAKENPQYQWLNSKVEVAKAAQKVTQSLSLPNIFGVATYQLLQDDLPVITPPWMVGIELHWNIFSFFENNKRIKAAKSLVKESQFIAESKKSHLETLLKRVGNKMQSLRQEVNTLDKARKTAAITTAMIRRRMESELSSVKEVNDALKVQLEVEKAYYTAVLGYNLAVATYLKILGQPKTITNYIKQK